MIQQPFLMKNYKVDNVLCENKYQLPTINGGCFHREIKSTTILIIINVKMTDSSILFNTMDCTKAKE